MFCRILNTLPTAWNTKISPNLIVMKFCRNAQSPKKHRASQNSAETAFPQNFHTRKLDKTTVFCAVPWLAWNRKLEYLQCRDNVFAYNSFRKNQPCTISLNTPCRKTFLFVNTNVSMSFTYTTLGTCILNVTGEQNFNAIVLFYVIQFLIWLSIYLFIFSLFKVDIKN